MRIRFPEARTPRVIIEAVWLWLKTASTARMMTMFGRAMNMSTTMPTERSTQPPRYPARMPSAIPQTANTPSASTTPASAGWPPCRSRLSTSRPSVSVPSQWEAEGPERAAGRSWRRGS